MSLPVTRIAAVSPSLRISEEKFHSMEMGGRKKNSGAFFGLFDGETESSASGK
jgi:hypothetical protein